MPIHVVSGRSRVVLVAPHGGRRDAVRRPWGGGTPLRMNDLHTAELTVELAERLDASAVVNADVDRNELDLARIGAAHDGAPAFLEAMAGTVGRVLARHARATVLMVHGWNVVQPAVDVGLGALPTAATLAGDGATAISGAFAGTTLPALFDALAAREVLATPGVRYPARARENLLQLFTRRHRDDPRPLVRRLAALAERADALQLELSLPLRLPGSWRERFVDALADVLGRDDHPPRTVAAPTGAAHPPRASSLEFVAPGLCGLAAMDAGGARFLLFSDDGRLYHFTGERVGDADPHRVAGLRMQPRDDGRIDVRYVGPLLHFPDTTPFLDLERGLARATVVEADVAIAFTPAHRDDDGPCPSGHIVGEARIGDVAARIDGHGTQGRRGRRGGPVGASLRLDEHTVVIADGDGTGLLCRGGSHTAVAGFEAAPDGDPASLRIAATMSDGTRVETLARIRHRLPVVFGGAAAARLCFAACEIAAGLAGWLQLPDA